MTTDRGGFTIVEVLVAIIILTVGLLALAQSSAAVTTMIGRGKQDTQAAVVAQQVLAELRQLASTTTPNCTALTSGTEPGPKPGMIRNWVVSGSGDSRTVTVTITYRISRGIRADTIRAQLGCV